MSVLRTLRLLQSYFDGDCPDGRDVQYKTGLPEAEAEEVAEAIKMIKEWSFDDLHAMERGHAQHSERGRKASATRT